jgi:hypothetical protein
LVFEVLRDWGHFASHSSKFAKQPLVTAKRPMELGSVGSKKYSKK